MPSIDSLDPITRAVLDQELEHGARLMTVANLEAGLRAHGYCLDRSMDCRHMARMMTGPLAGKAFKSCSMRIREVGSDRSAAHFEGRRDSAYQAMREFSRYAYVILPGGFLADAC